MYVHTDTTNENITTVKENYGDIELETTEDSSGSVTRASQKVFNEMPEGPKKKQKHNNRQKLAKGAEKTKKLAEKIQTEESATSSPSSSIREKRKRRVTINSHVEIHEEESGEKELKNSRRNSFRGGLKLQKKHQEEKEAAKAALDKCLDEAEAKIKKTKEIDVYAVGYIRFFCVLKAGSTPEICYYVFFRECKTDKPFELPALPEEGKSKREQRNYLFFPLQIEDNNFGVPKSRYTIYHGPTKFRLILKNGLSRSFSKQRYPNPLNEILDIKDKRVNLSLFGLDNSFLAASWRFFVGTANYTGDYYVDNNKKSLIP